MKHILLVEDEQHLAFGIKYNLEAEGFEVTVAGDGPAALKVIEDDPAGVDMLVLDLMLPGMSGYAVCQSLREHGLDVPVLILSARTLPEDRIRGFDVGADQYLQKPFDLEELLSRVRNLLGRRGRSGAPPERVVHEYEFDNTKINFDTFEVSVDGQPLKLTHTQIKLLRYFIENEGLVVSRAQLLEQVWGMASTPTTRTVDNFIMQLRKFFEVDPAQPRHFLSVRGAGYRFVSQAESE
ncbi:MAG TPA: response regulator transcription factor [Pirellulales bacterium]